MTTYGEGFGQEYIRPVATSEITGVRREKEITSIVGGQKVTVIIRDTIIPEDPLLNMIRGTAYMYQTGGGPSSKFPIPPVGRDLKDVLIKINLII